VRIVMRPTATVREIARVAATIETMGCQAHIAREDKRTTIGAAGSPQQLDRDHLLALPGVQEILDTRMPFKLAGREFHAQPTTVRVGDLSIGGDALAVFAGPCAVESEDQMLATAQAVKSGGAHALRGGAFKPRTSPYSFQGLGREGLQILDRVRRATGLPVASEITHPEDVSAMVETVDILQIGARNMQNYALLQAVGRVQTPVLLKRGMMSTLEELLMSAEYILAQGNSQVILCERGIRTFETYTRNTLDISAVPLLKQLSHLPVIVDPSHGTGRRELVEPIALAAVAAGADGLLIEVHVDPDSALSDGHQSLTPARFEALMERLRPVADVVGRTM